MDNIGYYNNITLTLTQYNAVQHFTFKIKKAVFLIHIKYTHYFTWKFFFACPSLL